MHADHYFGTYARFDTASKKDAAILLGSDCIVGDYLAIEMKTEEGVTTAWLKNRFGSYIGYLDQGASRTVSVMLARGWETKAILSFVAFTDQPDPGHYWGEVALLCCDPAFADPFEEFLRGTAGRIAQGIRPAIDFGNQGFDEVVSSGGAWQPKQTVPFPSKSKGTAIMKKSRGMMDSVVEMGRSGNKGCYVVSWAFLLGIVALVVFGLKSCGVF